MHAREAAATPPEVAGDYEDAYHRAYRQSLAAHPTELMSPARPGKRAAEPTHRFAALTAKVLADPRRIRIAVGVGVLALLLVAYGAGRLFAAG